MSNNLLYMLQAVENIHDAVIYNTIIWWCMKHASFEVVQLLY